MCIPCDWLLLGDVTNSLLKRNKPSILLSTCRVVYTLLVSSSCGSLYQCDFKTYNLVCHVHACCHTQTDKQTHWHTERQNPFHVSALWTATTLSLSSVIAVNLVMLMIFPFSSDCHSKLPQPRHQAGGEGEAGQLSHSLEASRLLRCVCTTPGFLCWTCRGCVFCWRWCWCVNR